MEESLLRERNYDQSTFLWDYSISFITKMSGLLEQYHRCYKVVVSLDHNFSLTIDGQIFVGLRGIIVNERTAHLCFSLDVTVLVNYIESGSLQGRQLRNLLGDKAWIEIDSVLAPDQFSRILPDNYRDLSNEILIPQVNTFLDSLLLRTYIKNDFIQDERIEIVLRYINKNLHKKLELENISELINLSPERVRHLFVQQTGISFSQYVLWKRIRKIMAVTIMEEGKLTEVCVRFGFTDRSHFNRTFKRMFGLIPLGIINHGRVLL